ncbi:unnamed protein product [Didymodactylos carnosus]|uniref:Uncharacterized protein n=1 Tax=Didymodactylos carnosus TaxID=1234261 RepID=A0A814LI87_9BILA|nr:unnamed protein product [Didymodactylos carnosus]CAF1284019.1 unnamed protein product [Didymodactylos carnosus]CAF3833864.1 unnamed protein product [Didymodactylos carnosus]CAF4089008.1 unnamed protein product [Didymodactylos carnosus]
MFLLKSYPFYSYLPNIPGPIAFAVIIGLSLIGWIVQSIQAKFKPTRLIIIVTISHLTILIDSILRAVLSDTVRNTQRAYSASTSLLAVGQRLLIVSNYLFLVEWILLFKSSTKLPRIVSTVVILFVIISGVLLVPANSLSFNSEKLAMSVHFRQISCAIILCKAVSFYVLWFYVYKRCYLSSKKSYMWSFTRSILLLSINSLLALCVAIYLVVFSIPEKWNVLSQNEVWFYYFHLGPIILSQCMWTLNHPKYSLPRRRTIDKDQIPTLSTTNALADI